MNRSNTFNMDHELLSGGLSKNAFFTVNWPCFYRRRLVFLSSRLDHTPVGQQNNDYGISSIMKNTRTQEYVTIGNNIRVNK